MRRMLALLALATLAPLPAVAAERSAPSVRMPDGDGVPLPDAIDWRDPDSHARALHASLTRPRAQGGAGMTWLGDRARPTEAASHDPSDVWLAFGTPTGDIDGDGAGDLLTVEYTSDGIAVVGRRGTTGAAIYEVPIGGSASALPLLDIRHPYVLAADLDLDGVLDIAALTIAYRPLVAGYTLDQRLTIHDGATGEVRWSWERGGSVVHHRVGPSPRYGTYVTRVENALLVAALIADVNADGAIDPFVETCDLTLAFVREDEVRSEGACTGDHLDSDRGTVVTTMQVDAAASGPLLYPVGDLDGDRLGDVLLLDEGADGSLMIDARRATGAPLWVVSTPPARFAFLFLAPLHAEHLDVVVIWYDVDEAVADAHDGATGAVMWSFDYYAEPGWFSFVGDVAGDGGTDLLVQESDATGLTMRAVDGATRTTTLWERRIARPEGLGIEGWTGALGDLDRDGAEEIELVTYRCDEECAVVAVGAIDGRGGGTMWQVPDRPEAWGAGGDVDGDGIDEVWSVVRTGDAVSLHLAGGATGEVLRTFGTVDGAEGAFLWASDLAPSPGDEVVVQSWRERDMLDAYDATGAMWRLRFGG